MKIERDERKFDFHDIGLAIKKAREREGLTQEQLASIVDRDTRTIMYHENDGQHPSLNVFYQLTTMFGISVDQFFYPEMGANEATVKRINIMLQSLNELAIFASRGAAKTRVGEPPQTRHFGTNCPKVGCLRHRRLSLLFLIFALVRQAE